MLTQGAHNRYVANELLRLATTKNGCSLEHVIYKGGSGAAEEIRLVRPKNDPNAEDMKGTTDNIIFLVF